MIGTCTYCKKDKEIIIRSKYGQFCDKLEYQKQVYKQNPKIKERARENARRNYHENREECLRRSRQWAKDHKEKQLYLMSRSYFKKMPLEMQKSLLDELKTIVEASP